MTVDDDPQYSATFFRALAGVALRLEERDLAIYEAQYDYLSFGSWVVVVGQRHRRRRFIWDGKESRLTVEESHFGSSADGPAWKPVETVAIDDAESVNPNRILERILEHA